MCVSPEDSLISELEFKLEAATDREAKLETKLETKLDAAFVREKELVRELSNLVQWIEDDIHRPGTGLRAAQDLIDQYWKARAMTRIDQKEEG